MFKWHNVLAVGIIYVLWGWGRGGMWKYVTTVNKHHSDFTQKCKTVAVPETFKPDSLG